jgi:phytoene dehydrogenase-like protein
MGHLLRQPLPRLATPSTVLQTRTVIVGGGVAGLSAAWALDRAGWDDFLVLDLESEAGGTSTWADYPESSAPWAAHYLPVPTAESRAVRVLLEELGVITGYGPQGAPRYREDALCQSPQERLFMYSTWIDGLYPRVAASTRDKAELEEFHRDMESWRRLAVSDGRRPFAIPRAASSRDPRLLALDQMSMAEYMQRKGWKSPRLRWFVQYACRDDYGCKLEHTSAWAGIHYFTARGHSSKTAEQSITESDELLTWPEGNGWLARRLKERAGARVRTSVFVLRVTEDEQGVLVDALDRRTGAMLQVRAHEAIVAVPSFIAARILPDLRGELEKALVAFTYAPWVVSNVVLEREPSERPGGLPLAWDNVIYDSDTLGYVTATHQSLRTTDGPTVLTHYLPLSGGDPATERQFALRQPWDYWRNRALSDIAGPHPGIERLVRKVDVMVWGHAMIRPLPGLMWSDGLVAAGRPRGRVRFAHTDLSGMAIFEEAQYHGVRAAESIMTSAQHAFHGLT